LEIDRGAGAGGLAVGEAQLGGERVLDRHAGTRHAVAEAQHHIQPPSNT
jgi:hypothetical protein